MMDERRKDDFILQIYDALLEPTSWRALLDELSDAVDVFGIMMLDIDPRASEPSIAMKHVSTSHANEVAEYFMRTFGSVMLTTQNALAAQCMNDRDIIVHEDTASFSNRDPSDTLGVQQDAFILSRGIGSLAGALLNKDHFWRDRFCIQIRSGRPYFNEQELGLLHAVLPHFAKAAALSEPLAELRRRFGAVLTMLDRLRVGVAIISETGDLVDRNMEMQRLIEDRVIAQDPHGRLTLNDSEAQRNLHRLMGDMRAHGEAGARPRCNAVLCRRDPKLPLCIELCPISGVEMRDARHSYFILYALDPENTYEVDIATMAQAFQLTPAESSVLGMITEGRSNREISEHRSVSVETINSQVKTLLSKTYADNRVQLVRLATSFTIPIT